jgi:hypothetical protein
MTVKRDVCWLQVAVNYTGFVGMVEGHGHLKTDFGGFAN